MEFNVKSGHPEKQRTACIVAGVFETRRLSGVAERIDQLSEGHLTNIIRRGDLEGKVGQTLLLHNVPGLLADRVLLVGCGKERELTDKQFFEIIKKTIETLNQTGAMDAVCFLTELNIKGRDTYWAVKQAVLSTLETRYTFDEFKSKKDQTRRPLRKMIFTVSTRRELPLAEKAILEGEAVGKGVALTKNLGNMPPNLCKPSYLVEQAKALSKAHPKISTAILDEKEMQALKMGSLLAVAAGSDSPAFLITLEYRGAKKDKKPYVLVGKGITFDTGGNSLKPAINMVGMKFDMCGAAAVLGVFEAIATLSLPINLVGVIPTCENMISGHASRPDDVVVSMSGKSIEILNTDAEGRLILADALTYSERFEPEVVIDIATLTGACVVALGKHATGLYSNHNALANELLNAGLTANDKAWHMPLWDEYHEQLKSNIADLANVGGPEAGSVTAACFLSNFTKKYHWAHLDVAGTAANSYNGSNRGATGRPVPMIVQFLLDKLAKS